MNIVVLIQTRNEEAQIKAAIESSRLLTDSIVVVDMESSDKTATIAREMGARVYRFPYSHYVEPAREYGIKQAKGDWVFILDADERITPELAREVREIVAVTPHTHFKIPRKNIFAGRRWLKHGGWWKDYQIRLIKRSSLVSWDSRIHSTPQIHGTLGYLSVPFEHYFHPNLENMVEKTRTYENIEAELLYKAGRSVSTKTFFRKFLGELYRRLVKHHGYLDGTYGIIESMYQAYSKTITWLFLYEKKHIKP